jgi:hypothetical protein
MKTVAQGIGSERYGIAEVPEHAYHWWIDGETMFVR